MAVLKYKNGVTGTFITGTGFAPGTNRLEIVLDKGSLVLENNNTLTVYELAEKEQDFSKRVRTSFENPKVTTIKYDFPVVEDHHTLVANAWARKILYNEGELIADGEDGINELTLSNAMYLSGWLNKPVTLPLDEDLFYEELMKRVATSRIKQGESVFADTAGTYAGSK